MPRFVALSRGPLSAGTIETPFFAIAPTISHAFVLIERNTWPIRNPGGTVQEQLVAFTRLYYSNDLGVTWKELCGAGGPGGDVFTSSDPINPAPFTGVGINLPDVGAPTRMLKAQLDIFGNDLPIVQLEIETS